MAIIGSDTFVRADQSGWGTASDGQTWSQVQGAGTLAIASNEGTFTGQIATDEVMVLGSTNQADTDCLVRFKVTNSGNDVPGVVFRSNGSNTFYRVRNNSGTLGIRRINAGSSTTIGADVTVTMSSGVFYWIRGRIVGSTISCTMWADGGSEPAPQIVVTDGTPISAAGRFGIYASINTTTTDTIFYDHFTATDTISFVKNLYVPFGIPRAFGATYLPPVIKPPLIYTPRAFGGTILTDSRIFVPRAFGGVYIPDNPNLLWVPHAVGNTTQGVTSALTRTLAGVGTLTGTLSLSTALTSTLAGVGTLTGTLSLATALSDTLAGVGTLSGTLSANTALSVTLPGVGTLNGTLSAKTALSATMTGVGTLNGTLSANTALTVTLAGVGTLNGTLSTGNNVALAVTMAGVGTLSGVFSLRVALSLTFAGMGTLAGTLSIPSLSFLTATWITRDLTAIWITRDGKATWTTRDEKASWATRDEQATWDTRDDKATWTTRS
jgi:hypothetical protein